MIVFKLERERLPCVAYRDTLFYVKDRYVRSYDFRTQKDNPLISVRRSGSGDSHTTYRSLSYNPAEHSVILTNDSDGGSFELYQLPKDTSRGETSPVAKKHLFEQISLYLLSRIPGLDWVVLPCSSLAIALQF